MYSAHEYSIKRFTNVTTIISIIIVPFHIKSFIFLGRAMRVKISLIGLFIFPEHLGKGSNNKVCVNALQIFRDISLSCGINQYVLIFILPHKTNPLNRYSDD